MIVEERNYIAGYTRCDITSFLDLLEEVLSASCDMIKVYANVENRHFIFVSSAEVLRLKRMM